MTTTAAPRHLAVVPEGGPAGAPDALLEGDGGPAAAPGGRSLLALSPSRAADFLTCPLLYRFRALDRLPEPASAPAVRGTVVHAALERLFDLPPQARTPEAARELHRAAWDELLAADPQLATLHADDAEREAWLAAAGDVIDGYFALEDPQRLEPADRELHVECELPSGVRLRGFVDRLDAAPDGRLRVVDYKTGKAPGEQWESRALFQMRFYALVIWRTRGVVPSVLQLLYLGDREVLRYVPDEADLLATERKLDALWAAIDRSLRAREFRPSPGRLCGWCDHQALCPAFGGTPPPWPADAPASLERPVEPGPVGATPRPRAATPGVAARPVGSDPGPA